VPDTSWWRGSSNGVRVSSRPRRIGQLLAKTSCAGASGGISVTPRHLEGPGPRAARAPQPRAVRGDLRRSADAVLPRRRADRDARRHDRRGRDRRPPRLGASAEAVGVEVERVDERVQRARTRALASVLEAYLLHEGHRVTRSPHGVPRALARNAGRRSATTARPRRLSGGVTDVSRGRDRRRRPRRRRGRPRRRPWSSAIARPLGVSSRSPRRAGVVGPRRARTPAVPATGSRAGRAACWPAGTPAPASEPGSLRFVDARVR
jgi:hypothetical protein